MVTKDDKELSTLFAVKEISVLVKLNIILNPLRFKGGQNRHAPLGA
jgi:hypothetical protein